MGLFPKRDEINLDGLRLSDEARDVLFDYDREGWQAEMASIGEYLAEFGPRLPAALEAERQRVAKALEAEAKKAAA